MRRRKKKIQIILMIVNELKQQAIELKNLIKHHLKEIDNPVLVIGIL